MSIRSPLGNNYGWIVNTDHRFTPRDLNHELHGVLAIAAVVQDPELSKIEKVLGYPVILAVRLGTRTISVRIYKRKDVETRPDNLASRVAEQDFSAYMVFNDSGGLTLLEGRLRELAQGHAPAFYADRVLSPRQVIGLDGLQAQFTGNVPRQMGLPKPGAPLSEVEGWVEDDLPEPPTLEPATNSMR